MNRRDFLKGMLATAAVASSPVSFALFEGKKQHEIAIKPYKVNKTYRPEYSAEMWTVSVYAGEIKGNIAEIDLHMEYSRLVDTDDKKLLQCLDDRLIQQASVAFDRILKEKYGNYKAKPINR